MNPVFSAFDPVTCLELMMTQESEEAESAIAAVLELERRRQEAVAAGDMAALDAIMADDLVHVHANAMVHDKGAYIAHMANSKRKVERRGLAVRIYGDIAVLTGENINLIEVPGATARRMAVFATQVAARRDGIWQFVSFQATPIPN
jgi:ketosteroid isomerase-like protein